MCFYLFPVTTVHEIASRERAYQQFHFGPTLTSYCPYTALHYAMQKGYPDDGHFHFTAEDREHLIAACHEPAEELDGSGYLNLSIMH